ncbi:MAG: PVC-type heme-binding CxxCH protein [Planctomycetota bacterium]
MRRLCSVCLVLSIFNVAFAQKAKIHTAEQPLAPVDAAQTMNVPEGVRVTLFAGEPDVQQPIGFCIDDRGRLWVAEAYSYPVHSKEGKDRIIILEDVDGDGRHDRRTVFYDQLNYVSGIEVGFGGVWVMSPPYMYFIPDSDGDDIPDSEPRVVLDGFGTHANAHNIANGFAWGPDGWLYATHGRTNWSMIGRPGDTDSERQRFDGGVWRYHPTRDVWEPYADGTTNPWGIDWNDLGDAFICNCVNPHLFQVIQGAHYEPWRGRASSRYAYQRIDTIADHLHFVGLSNVRNGLGSEAEDSAGGGHAHCGTMIYLGDQFPVDYRNQLFTNNIHGRRINCESLRRSGSGYVASHRPDFMRSKDPWFMGVTLACGPEGEVYVSDWSDTGECHSTRNTRRSTGRIYRLTYLKNQLNQVDLRSMTNEALVDLQLDKNDWKVRHARRILHERFASGDDLSSIHGKLNQWVESHSETSRRLRALWVLHVTGGLTDERLTELLDHPDPNLRSWAITLLCEDKAPHAKAVRALERLARKDDSARVRLSLASAAQRLKPDAAWPIVIALASHGEDSDDQNLPLMVWYGLEPLIHDDSERFIQVAAETAIPRIAENAARRVIDSNDHRNDGLSQLISLLPQARQPEAMLRGFLIGLESQRNVKPPSGWNTVFRQLRVQDKPEINRLVVQLAMVFRDPLATQSLQQTMLDRDAPLSQRQIALQALAKHRVAGIEPALIRLLDDKALREQALKALGRYASKQTDQAILSRYGGLSDSEQQVAVQTLASRASWARSLVEAVERGQVPASDITAFTARQLVALGDSSLNETLKQHWGEIRDTPADARRQISTLQKSLTSEKLAEADLKRGKALYTQHCGKCHLFFGEGGKVGPDLTGAQRTNMTYLLENIIDPSASVAKDYQMEIVQTDDGRVLSGLIESESDDVLTVVNGIDRFVIRKDEIEARKSSDVSVMPVGLLQPLSEREIRDLFGYISQ